MPADTFPSYLLQFCEFATGMSCTSVPDDAKNAASRVLVDCLGAMLGGHREPEVLRLCEEILPLARGAEATVFTPGFPRTDRDIACLLNGVAGPSLEFDEGYRLASNHASISIVPAVLAEAEATGATGSAMAIAIIVGYEAGARVAKASKFTRSTSSYGVFSSIGAAVALAKLRGGDEKAIAAALCGGAASSFLSHHVQSFAGATVRNLWNGLGAQSAFQTCRLADGGFLSETDSLGITYGTLSGSQFDESVFAKDLGKNLAVTQNYFKQYPCCGHMDAAIEATLDATMGRPITPANVEWVEVETYAAAAAGNDAAPINPMAARFSLPWCVSSAIARGTVDVAATHYSALADVSMKNLAGRVRVRGIEGQGHYEEARFARVTVKLRDGTLMEGACANPPGDYRSSFSVDHMDAKFLSLASPTLGASVASRTLSLAKQIFGAPNVSALIGSLRESPLLTPANHDMPLSQARISRHRDYLDELSAFIVAAAHEDLPPSVRRTGENLFWQTIRGAIRESDRLRALLPPRPAIEGRCMLLSIGLPTSDVLNAAFLNGLACSSSRRHPFNPARRSEIDGIAAALAWAEHTDASGSALLTALILGADAARRLQQAAQLRSELHPDGIWSIVASAIAVAKLMGFDPLGMRETISSAACLALAGHYPSPRTRDCFTYSYNGRAAVLGIVAAISVRSGFTAPLDGPALIYGALTGGRFDSAGTISNLGREFCLPSWAIAASGETAKLDTLTSIRALRELI